MSVMENLNQLSDDQLLAAANGANAARMANIRSAVSKIIDIVDVIAQMPEEFRDNREIYLDAYFNTRAKQQEKTS